MKKDRFSRIILLLWVLLLLTLPAGAVCEGFGPASILSGEIDGPITLTLSAPFCTYFPAYGEERTAELNALLKHISAEITADGIRSESAILIDGEPALSWVREDGEEGSRTIYSLQPDTVYPEENPIPAENDSRFTGFLEKRFFGVNRILDELVPVFTRLPEAYPELAKTAAETLSLRGYGKGVRKVVLILKEEADRERLGEALCGFTESEECRRLVRSLTFSGTQKFVLLYGEEGQLIRVQYDGNAGLSEEQMRKVSVNWKCLRTAETVKDEITVKTPAISAEDRDNMTYAREIPPADPEKGQAVNWDMQLDIRAGQIRQEIAFNGTFTFSETEMNGQAVYTKRQDGIRTKKTIVPGLRKESGGDYSGTIEITDNSGKILTGGIKAGIRLSAGNSVRFPGTGNNGTLGITVARDRADAEELQQMIAETLVRRLLTLPAEDLAFLMRDIPAEDMASLVQLID